MTAGEVVEVELCFEEARGAAARSQSGLADAPLLRDEVAFGIDLVGLVLRDARARLEADGYLESVPARVRADLGADLDALTERYRSLWSANNRPGGLEDSVRWLSNLRQAYATGRPDPIWGGIRVPTPG